MCGFAVFSKEFLESHDFNKKYQSLVHRGPDDHQVHESETHAFVFHRLSIRDLSDHGRQPFQLKDGTVLVCNGEIYNYETLKEDVDFDFQSSSDCEVLLPLILKYGLKKTAKLLDAEFALVYWDADDKKLKAARDPIGIRPLFYGYDKKTGKISFASEAKALTGVCRDITPFPPGHVYDGESFSPYINLTNPKTYLNYHLDHIGEDIHDLLSKAVEKRLVSDAPVGFLLSGGLDSSLVCSIASRKMKQPLKTFAIGMESDPIDLKYADIVAKHIGADHTEVKVNKGDVLSALREVIWHLETFDITTVRASLGMYLVCRYIKKNTDVKVLLTGEVSDELFGYKYTDFAPSAEEFQKEAKKRIDELYIYDVLRADRCIAANSLEARVPFSDTDFVKYVMSIDPKLKMNSYAMGKYLLRHAFDRDNYLPEQILWRDKAAFSDAVGHSLVDCLKDYAEEVYSDLDLKAAKLKYTHATPNSKESLLYRDIFEEFYKGQSKLIKDFWMPNKNWKNCNVTDPSARVLPNYGASGK